jgi:hypothetical protein
MKAMRAISVLFFASSLALGQEKPAPFGLKMGARATDFANAESSNSPGFFSLKSVPRPDPAFQLYIVEIGPTTGLCSIKAIGNRVDTSPRGTELQAALNTLQKTLTDTYGSGKDTSRQPTDDSWKKESEWMRSLCIGERISTFEWSAANGSKMKPGITRIVLSANACSETQGYAVVEYFFDNYDVCEKELEREAASKSR